MAQKGTTNGKAKFNMSGASVEADVYNTHLMEFTSSVNRSISEILDILPLVAKKKRILEIYTRDLAQGSAHQPLSSYFHKYNDLAFSELDDAINSFRFLIHGGDILSLSNGISATAPEDSNTTTNSDTATHDGMVDKADDSAKKIISRQKQLRTNQNYRDVISFLPGTEIPDVDLNNQAKTVMDIWEEWNFGYKGFPPLAEIEAQWGTKWRRGRIAKSAQRRKKMVEFIQHEFQKHPAKIITMENVVNELEKYRLTRGKGLFWLYGNIPESLYDENGDPLSENDGQMLIRHKYHDESTDQSKAPAQKANAIDSVSHEELVNSATAAVLAQQRNHSTNENSSNGHTTQNENEEETDQTPQTQDSTQSTEGDLRRLENIQRLIDQHQNVGLSELGDHTDPALEKL